MPPKFIFDITGLDFSEIVFTQQDIRDNNPQRGAMEMLNGIVYAEPSLGRVIGFKDIRDDEFWIAGHIPGRPLFPGVLMIEAGAQLASFYARKFVGWKEFIGFGSVDECKFRLEVPPGKRMFILGQQIWHRHGRICCKVQGLVDGNLVYEATITGVKM